MAHMALDLYQVLDLLNDNFGMYTGMTILIAPLK